MVSVVGCELKKWWIVGCLGCEMAEAQISQVLHDCGAGQVCSLEVEGRDTDSVSVVRLVASVIYVPTMRDLRVELHGSF